MAKYILYYIEWHSDIDFWESQDGVKLQNIEGDGWGEFEHSVKFEANSLEEAKKLASGLCESTSGVYCVYQNDVLLFTEEDEE